MFHQFLQKISTGILRFPVAIVFCLAATLLISREILFRGEIPETFHLVFSFFIAAIFSTAGEILHESHHEKNRFIWQIPAIIFAGIFYFFVAQYFGSKNILCILVFFSLIYAAGMFGAKNPSEKYAFLFGATKALFTAVSISVLLIGLGTLLITIFFKLSHFENQGTIIYIWDSWSVCFFGVLNFLALLPKPGQDSKTYENSKIFPIIICFILLPFFSIYGLILYAYSLKIFLNFSQWQNGIAFYILVFATIGYITFAFSRAFSHKKSVAIFTKIFPYAVFFQIFPLFYALYLRINQYGITTNRYVAMLAGGIFLGLSLYFIVRKNRGTITAIPASIAIVATIFLAGPWGVYQFPWETHFREMKEQMKELKIYENGNFSPYTSGKNPEISEKISAKMDYVFEHYGIPSPLQKDKLRQFFAPILAKNFSDSPIQASKLPRYEIVNFLGLDYCNIHSCAADPVTLVHENSSQKHISLERSLENYYEIRDFDYMIPFSEENKKIFIESAELTIWWENYHIYLQEKSGKIESFSLENIAREMILLTDEKIRDQKKLEYFLESPSYSAKIHIYDIVIYKNLNEKNNLSPIATLFLKKK